MLVQEQEKNELRVLTIEELRAFNGLSELTDEQALEIIQTLKQLSLLTYQIINNYEH